MAGTTRIRLTVNGRDHEVEVEDRWTLLEVLRENLDLTGAKRGCDRAECGTCTVLLDGKPVYACHLLAVQARGHAVETIEEISTREDFRPLLEAFVRYDGGQCGFCTPGFAVAAYALLKQYPEPQDFHVRWGLVGHLCRCNAYDKIVASVLGAGRDTSSSPS
jgi:aerobic-type carbon monoxide dehydrogenase small subunit (CoxS/CutS family)